jgi:L-seryl-tRNA(Ser) seleniumtransferase
VAQPNSLSNRTPSLRVLWDPNALGLTGNSVVTTLLDTEPRVALAAAGQGTLSGVSITPYMMSAGDERIIADRLVALLSNGKPGLAAPAVLPPSTDVSGRWDVRITYAAGASTHTLQLRQRSNDIAGSHQGDFMTRDVTGTIEGDAVRIRSAVGEEHGEAISLLFTGKVSGTDMAGTLDMGEYLGATWTAKRRGNA